MEYADIRNKIKLLARLSSAVPPEMAADIIEIAQILEGILKQAVADGATEDEVYGTDAKIIDIHTRQVL